MGDRASVDVVTSTNGDGVQSGVCLYTHWSGYKYADTVAKALDAARNRWDDDAYFLRIFVDQFFADVRDEETGGGLVVGLGVMESEYPRLVVDGEARTVTVGEPDYGSSNLTGRVLSFEEFIQNEELRKQLQG